ncbi:MAG: hypothetical protein KGQ36_01940 [Rickettsiales bacterium]|nr:hypothetical protein [Rickettsiales bacterium]
MKKAAEAVVIITLMIFSFILGVKCSDSVKSHAGWLFETKEDDVELPDLTNDGNGEINVIDENGAPAENPPVAPTSPEGDFDSNAVEQESNSGQTLQP